MANRSREREHESKMQFTEPTPTRLNRDASGVSAGRCPSAAGVATVDAEVATGGAELATVAVSPWCRLVSSAQGGLQPLQSASSHKRGVPRGAFGRHDWSSSLGEIGFATECQLLRGNADRLGLRQRPARLRRCWRLTKTCALISSVLLEIASQLATMAAFIGVGKESHDPLGVRLVGRAVPSNLL